MTLTLSGSGNPVTIDGTDSGLTLVRETAKSATGTSVDFTGIPSWVKRVTLMFNTISGSGNSQFLVKLGTSSGFVSTGYNSYASTTNGSITTNTTGFLASASGHSSANTFLGQMTIVSFGGTAWSSSGILVQSSTNGGIVGGYVDLGGTLTQIRITTVNGTDIFDAGTINIMYE